MNIKFLGCLVFGGPAIIAFGFSFINKYGTHYISEAKMGSYYLQQSILSRNSYFEMVLNGIDIEVYAGFSAVGSINPSFANQTEAEIFQGYILGVL